MAEVKRHYLVDEGGRRVAIVLPLKEYAALLEDMADLALMAERRGEPSEPWEVVKQRLEKKWRNTA
ncbi:MAG: hypothetical protein HY686_04325 [Chloroflexi bacterium]|nr:hypothetical protein [Chloroflexota bacterium]